MFKPIVKRSNAKPILDTHMKTAIRTGLTHLAIVNTGRLNSRKQIRHNAIKQRKIL